MLFELVVGAFIITNTIAQLYDIVWCRWHHCGKSSKNSVEPRGHIFDHKFGDKKPTI